MSDRIPFRANPMLATLVNEPFHRPGWVYEEKYDGDRILAYKEGTKVRLMSRRAKDHTELFPNLAVAIRGQSSRTLLLDGEVVAFDRRGISRFQLLQQRRVEPSYAVFDCLFANGHDLRRQPLSIRRQRLETVLRPDDHLLLARRLADHGLAAYRIVKRKGYEGFVAKELASPYIEGRSTKWLKVKVRQEDEFLIVGYTPPSGSRRYFGALLLAAYDRSELCYVGKVGTGFNQRTLASLWRRFQPLIRASPSVVNPPHERGVTYLRAHLIAQVAYEEWTADRKLRQPAFLGLRTDKRPDEVVFPEASA